LSDALEFGRFVYKIDHTHSKLQVHYDGWSEQCTRNDRTASVEDGRLATSDETPAFRHTDTLQVLTVVAIGGFEDIPMIWQRQIIIPW